MDFKNELLTLAKSVEELKPFMETEEATKNALVIPFLKALGYNIFDPREVRPEFTCDIAEKKGEKIDYALFGENKVHPLVLIECKHWNCDLNRHFAQLRRYYGVSKAKFGLLTNGIQYRFYTDLEHPHIMDETPFFEFNMSDIKDNNIEHLKNFHKSNFNIEAITSSAKELKYLGLFREVIKTEFENPSQELVKHFLTKVGYTKVKTEDRLVKYSKLLKNSLDNYITERVNNNLRRAMESENTIVEQTEQQNQLPEGIVSMDEEKGTVTTEEEIEGYKIIKAILGIKIAVDRIVYRDNAQYFTINYDNANKPICRLYFNNKEKKQIGLFNEGKFITSGKAVIKQDVKYDINTLDDIYKYSQQLLDTIDLYDKGLYAKPSTQSSDNTTEINE